MKVRIKAPEKQYTIFKIDIGSQLELEKSMCIILALCLGCHVNWKNTVISILRSGIAVEG